MAYEPGCFPADAIYGGQYKRDEDLPTGTWNVMANGRIFELEIRKVSGGRVDGQINSGTFKDGAWDSDSGTFKFTRVGSFNWH